MQIVPLHRRSGRERSTRCGRQVRRRNRPSVRSARALRRSKRRQTVRRFPRAKHVSVPENVDLSNDIKKKCVTVQNKTRKASQITRCQVSIAASQRGARESLSSSLAYYRLQNVAPPNGSEWRLQSTW